MEPLKYHKPERENKITDGLVLAGFTLVGEIFKRTPMGALLGNIATDLGSNYLQNLYDGLHKDDLVAVMTESIGATTNDLKNEWGQLMAGEGLSSNNAELLHEGTIALDQIAQEFPSIFNEKLQQDDIFREAITTMITTIQTPEDTKQEITSYVDILLKNNFTNEIRGFIAERFITNWEGNIGRIIFNPRHETSARIQLGFLMSGRILEIVRGNTKLLQDVYTAIKQVQEDVNKLKQMPNRPASEDQGYIDSQLGQLKMAVIERIEEIEGELPSLPNSTPTHKASLKLTGKSLRHVPYKTKKREIIIETQSDANDEIFQDIESLLESPTKKNLEDRVSFYLDKVPDLEVRINTSAPGYETYFKHSNMSKDFPFDLQSQVYSYLIISANALAQLGQKTEAKAAYEKALELVPKGRWVMEDAATPKKSILREYWRVKQEYAKAQLANLLELPSGARPDIKQTDQALIDITLNLRDQVYRISGLDPERDFFDARDGRILANRLLQNTQEPDFFPIEILAASEKIRGYVEGVENRELLYFIAHMLKALARYEGALNYTRIYDGKEFYEYETNNNLNSLTAKAHIFGTCLYLAEYMQQLGNHEATKHYYERALEIRKTVKIESLTTSLGGITVSQYMTKFEQLHQKIGDIT